jgi:hypothetical protein
MGGRHGRLAAGLLTAVLLLTGCAGSGDGGTGSKGAGGTGGTGTTKAASPPDNGIGKAKPADVIDRAYDALASASSVRIKGDMEDKGDKVKMDLRLTSNDEASGWIETEGSRLHIIRIRTQAWIKGRAFLEATGGKEMAELVGDRWVKYPGGAKGADELTDGMDLKSLAKEFKPDDGGIWVKSGNATMHGLPAIRLRALDGSLFVARTGKPYPLRLDAIGPGQVVDFTEYDRKVKLKAPAGALDLEKLGAGG